MTEVPVTEPILVEMFLFCDPLVGEPAVYEVYHHRADDSLTCTCPSPDPCEHAKHVDRKSRVNGGSFLAKTPSANFFEQFRNDPKAMRAATVMYATVTDWPLRDR